MLPSPSYIPILKAKKGEFDAIRQIRLEQIKTGIRPAFHPLFELSNIYQPVSRLENINKRCEEIGRLWSGNIALIDGYFWQPAESILENGDHFLPYAFNKLYSNGVKVVPVIGYDRWFDQMSSLYNQTMRTLNLPEAPYFCIRLDGDAMYDIEEPEFFEEQLDSILSGLKLAETRCAILIDFGDVSLNRISIESMLLKSADFMNVLKNYDFKYIAISGASYPESVADAVNDHDTDGLVLRKEMLVWQSLRKTFPKLRLKLSDYGIWHPSIEKHIVNKHTNGKIIYTIDLNYLVVRGHPFSRDGGKQTHRKDLAMRLIVNHLYYQGASFSWGDDRIFECAHGLIGPGSSTNWVSYSTSHHIKYVVEEIRTFEIELAQSNTKIGF